MWLRIGFILFYLLILNKGSSGYENSKYEGCYKEWRYRMRLTEITKCAPRTLTVQQCIAYCFSNGYKYAAMKNGTECHCGDLPENGDEPPYFPIPDSNIYCNVPCSNDYNMDCGGRRAFSLYSTGIKENIEQLRDIGKLQIGCLNDSLAERLLPDHKSDLFRTNTPKRCIAYCRALGYPHAGVQYRFECHCGVAKITSPIVDGCDLPCSGNPGLRCGGFWRLMLYSTMSDSSNSGISLNGCYTYDEDLGSVGRTIPNNTPNKCVAYCHYQGLPFAHIHQGEECMCSSVMPHTKSRVSLNQCQTPCPGDSSLMCGTESHMITYYTGTNGGEASLGKLVSCFYDGNGDLLDGPKFNLGNENSIGYCTSKCIQMGYAFAGLRKGMECQCSQSSPSKLLLRMVPDHLCSMPCPKAELQYCGGENYISLYRTGLKPPNKEEEEEDEGYEETTQEFVTERITTIAINEYIENNQVTEGATQENLIEKTTTEIQLNSYTDELNKDENEGTTRENVTKRTTTIDLNEPIESNLLGDEDVVLKATPVSPGKLYPGYMGCYNSDRSEIQLTSEHQKTERTLTIHQCNSYCFIRGYKFAATKNGSDCFCGDLPEDGFPTPDDDRLCNVPCLSDYSTKCGGLNAFTLYSTGIKENDIGDIKKLEIGCLSDEDETRLIREHKTDLIKTNSPKRCIAYCKALGYQHAGVQYGIECYCGLSQRTSPTANDCTMPCSGDPNSICGGSWRMNVYSTGTFDNTMDITLDGCYIYDERSFITSKTIEDMTPNKCVAHCFSQGFQFSHIYNGNECLCGSKVPQAKFKVRMSKCDITCRGDPNQICGGETHMLSYTTGAVGDPVLGKMESCYRDEEDNLLIGPKLILGMENSIPFCISRCIELGFAFAALKNVVECQCTDQSPRKSLMKMVPNDNCNAPCPRVELQNCGAEQRLALYRTGLAPYNKRLSGAVLPGYQGCYRDNRNEIRLTGHQATVRSMTRKGCNSLCFSRGFKHAATRDGKECYCGDLDVNIPNPDDESLCNVPCTSDITTKCGGKNAYSLFSTGIKDEDIDNVDELEIGCITDSEDIRLIPEHKIDLTITNTPKRCIAYCRALGYPHAGTQYSLECYCGQARKTSPSVEGCDLPCTGDATLSCGGHWKANVYSTGITKPTPGVSTRGCFSYNRTLITTKKTIPRINSNKCASNCYSQGFPFAFVNAGSECLCGSYLPPSKFQAAAPKCNIMCDGAKCGGTGTNGETFMTAYTTGVVGDPILGKLVGCYKDESNTLLTGPKMNIGVLNSISLCISRCMEQGFAFAGLRNTFECQCSQTSPKRTPVKIVPDYECATPCPQVQLQACGAPLFTAIHRTGVVPPAQVDCITSITRVNGKEVCGGLVIFSDEFDSMNISTWGHSVKISGEDAEFVTYTKKSKNVYVKNGKLVITPTLVKDKFVQYGTLDLKGCTAEVNSLDCKAQAKSYHILPPAESGQICTTRSFNFKYGIITIRAKLPKGDWVIPEFWLKPVKNIYGDGYKSGKLIIVTSRGNAELVSAEGMEIGNKIVESGFQVSEDSYKNVHAKMVSITGEPWSNDFHNYSVTWTDDTVLFYVDGNILSGLQTAYREEKTPLLEEMGLEKRKLWSSGSNLAPFDQEFYLCVGVSVGGIQSFPDDSVSNGFEKPWKNSDMKNRLKFWVNKHNWERTWTNETKLEVDYIKVTAY